VGWQADGKVVIRGQGQDLADVFSLESDLKNIKYFKNVSSRSTAKKKVKGREVTTFEIVFELDPDSQAEPVKSAKKI
jgi:hypothetical protein